MEINRIEVISAVVSEMIATLPEERRQKAYIHLFGTAQTAGLIALRRDVNAELAQISGLLHDYRKYLTGVDEKHAEESGNITRAIANHSDKENVGLPLDEVLKDADVLQHVLQNTTLPIRDKYEKRFEKLKKEFSL